MGQKYSCKECDFATDYVANTWRHTLKQHPDPSLELMPEQNENEVMLKCVAEQNAQIIEELDTFKNVFNGAFEKLADIVGSLKDESNEKCKTLADTVF